MTAGVVEASAAAEDEPAADEASGLEGGATTATEVLGLLPASVVTGAGLDGDGEGEFPGEDEGGAWEGD